MNSRNMIIAYRLAEMLGSQQHEKQQLKESLVTVELRCNSQNYLRELSDQSFPSFPQHAPSRRA